ncbi:uncharacterized protein A1O5_10418 [Cladophialophora psammophila CBS 110553]|uniref:Uncharacterized protein n=1 Tax=Cladophialophora psammophila CBS 110553 TaxID=1182543 RepID=W9WNM6_9EURO|nr:uncharacterized protein A1O5_10418 [Cladophialophora psammophila CBS 110553]EXJ66266.1 hypothetical protein A1O5_10418 [Cladophialophora psammophila CBS 110553]
MLHLFIQHAIGSIAVCLTLLNSLQSHSPSQSFRVSVSAAGVGPAVAENFPDPGLALDTSNGSETWYAFSTQTGKINVRLASSRDFSNWKLHEGYDALPTTPGWARRSPHAGIWAPDVNQRPDGSWVMYFAAVGRTHPQKHCIGAATSPNVTGPYTPLDEPIVCNLPRGGNIDPNLFVDPINNENYLVYKTDGNAIGHGGACGNTKSPVVPTPLYLQLMDPQDLVTPIGQPVYLFSNANSFKEDGPNVERPCMVYRNSTYYLLYNAHCFASPQYRIDYVSCRVGVDTHTGILGCNWDALKMKQQTSKDHTLLQTGDVVSGTKFYAPGSMDVSPDQRRVVFHGDVNLEWFAPHHPHSVHRDRAMFAGEIDFVKSVLRVTQLF